MRRPDLNRAIFRCLLTAVVAVLLEACLAGTVFAESPAGSVLEFNLQAGSGVMLEARANAPLSSQGNHLTYDSHSFYINGRPVFLHAGEIQYARIPESEWEDRIIKAKNSGLNCVATYVFWNVVEPVQGVFNFSGRYDLHRFIALCQKHGLLVILRMGPIANAEMRNGGLPQWVRERIPGEYHTELYPTPEWYFDAVKIYYQQLEKQVQDFFPSHGGNLVLVQIDNETHVSWIWGRKETKAAAQITINRLQQLAKDVGFEGPFSCTGWLGDLGVMAEGSLPTTGAYPINAWSPFDPPKIDHFDITDAHHHYDGSPLDAHAQPVFSQENQGGCAYYGITPDSYVAAYNASDIAGGVNATCYYVFAGGTNPQRYPGPYFDLYYGEGGVCHPDDGKMSYDYGAPLGEFQDTRKTVNYIRRLGLFLNNYGDTLERTSFVAPSADPLILGHTNQASFRGVNASGFVFINSYKLPDDNASQPLTIECKMGDQIETWPSYSTLTMRRNHPLTLPFRMNIDGVKFRYATASPLCRFDGAGGRHAVFYGNDGDQVEYFFEGITAKDILYQHGAKLFPQADGVAVVVDPTDADNLVVIHRRWQKPLIIKTLSERDSLRAYRLDGLAQALLLTDLVPLEVRDGKLRFEYTEAQGQNNELSVYPTAGFGRRDYINSWSKQTVKLNQTPVAIPFTAVGDGTYKATIDRSAIPADAKELWITTTPLTAPHGAEFYVDGMLASDTYYRRDVTGAFAPWKFGVKRFLRANSQQWVVQPQPDGRHVRLLNKLTGGVLAVGGGQANQIQLDDGKLPATTGQLWEISSEGRIKNSTTGLVLGADGAAALTLLPASTNVNQSWGIIHADECYSTITNAATGAILDVAAPHLLSAAPAGTKFEVVLKSYQFAPFDAAKPSFAPITYTSGDFARVAASSYLKEGTVKLDLTAE